MGLALLDLIKPVSRVAKQTLGSQAGEPPRNQFACKSILPHTVFVRKRAIAAPNS